MIICFVRADSAIALGNGVMELRLNSDAVSDADAKTIERLFPNLTAKAHMLLNQEALVQSVASEAEICAKPPPVKSKYASDSGIK